MKKLIFFLSMVFASSALFAQHGADDGKTWYDDKKTKLKEVYSIKEVNILNPNDPYGEMKTETKKHGPYFYYYESGKLKISGNYKDDEKHGEWKYYNQEGDVIKIEKYTAGELISTDEDPGGEDESGNAGDDDPDDSETEMEEITEEEPE